MHATRLHACCASWPQQEILAQVSHQRVQRHARRDRTEAICCPGSHRKRDSAHSHEETIQKIGDRGGGLPTAEVKLTLYRVHMPFIFMHLWADTFAGPANATLDFQPENTSRTRNVECGQKPVKDIFHLCMLLSVITSLLEKTLTLEEVTQLETYIATLNRKQSELQGWGWLTYNSHECELERSYTKILNTAMEVLQNSPVRPNRAKSHEHSLDHLQTSFVYLNRQATSRACPSNGTMGSLEKSASADTRAAS